MTFTYQSIEDFHANNILHYRDLFLKDLTKKTVSADEIERPGFSFPFSQWADGCISAMAGSLADLPSLSRGEHEFRSYLPYVLLSSVDRLLRDPQLLEECGLSVGQISVFGKPSNDQEAREDIASSLSAPFSFPGSIYS